DVKLTLTDVFDLYQVSQRGPTTLTGISFGGAPLPVNAAKDSFFGEMFEFNITHPPSTETTGGFEFSGLNPNKYYSFTIFASHRLKDYGQPIDIREAKYTITGFAGAQSALLNATDNKTNVANIISIKTQC